MSVDTACPKCRATNIHAVAFLRPDGEKRWGHCCECGYEWERVVVVVRQCVEKKHTGGGQ